MKKPILYVNDQKESPDDAKSSDSLFPQKTQTEVLLNVIDALTASNGTLRKYIDLIEKGQKFNP